MSVENILVTYSVLQLGITLIICHIERFRIFTSTANCASCQYHCRARTTVVNDRNRINAKMDQRFASTTDTHSQPPLCIRPNSIVFPLVSRTKRTNHRTDASFICNCNAETASFKRCLEKHKFSLRSVNGAHTA